MKAVLPFDIEGNHFSDYAPDIVVYNDDGSIRRIAWTNEQNIIHRTEGPAIISYVGNFVSTRTWVYNGFIGANDQNNPDVIRYNHDGSFRKIWCAKTLVTPEMIYGIYSLECVGKRHRIGAPADIKFMGNRVISKTWFRNENIHNSNGPAIITYYETGGIRSEEWVDDDVHNNANGRLDNTITKIIYDVYGMVTSFKYYGKRESSFVQPLNISQSLQSPQDVQSKRKNFYYSDDSDDSDEESEDESDCESVRSDGSIRSDEEGDNEEGDSDESAE
jgi:hypothetical protein